MISVLTLVKNRDTHLRRLVEGLERSAVAPSELIVVDMSDAPVLLEQSGFPISVIRHETQGLPLAQARNIAAVHARSPDLLFLDVDCIPSSGLIGAMGAALAAQDALICADILYLGADAFVGGGWSDSGLHAAGARHPVRDFPGEGMRREENAGLFWSLAFGVSRATFHRLGGFDERFTGYGAEDTDFGFTARDAGVDLMFLSGAVAFHQHHGVSDPPLQHFADIVRNATIFHAKWGIWPMEGWLTPFQAMGLICWSETSLAVIRPPTRAEITGAARGPEARF